jgi:hypothetical protein
MGFTFVTVGGDNRFLTMGGQAAIQEMRSGTPDPAPERTSWGESQGYRGAVVVVERVVVPPNGSVSVFVWVSVLPSAPSL